MVLAVLLLTFCTSRTVTDQQIDVYHALIVHYNSDELDSLAYRLGYEPDVLYGDESSRSERAIAIVSAATRDSALQRLIQITEERR